MRVLVCGGRNYETYDLVYNTLFPFVNEIGCIIEGGAKGADRLGRRFAQEMCLPVETYPAKWHLYGKRAGYLRNNQMLEEGKPDLVVAFPGGKGTANMVHIARKAGVKVVEAKELSDGPA